ncbi:MAG: C39 family peptidase [Candidatus Berkelbacteria bacterium]
MKKNKKIKFVLLIAVLIAVLLVGLCYRFFVKNDETKPYLNSQIISSGEDFFKSNLISETETEVSSKNDQNLPLSYLIENFPFQSQAPLSNWDQLHDEACEEASVILVDYFLNHKNLSSDEMNLQILKMVDWQKEKTGQTEQKDLTTQETLVIAKDFFGLKGKIVDNASITDLKKEIAQNHAVIVPTAGRLLGNPNFRAPGPIYHMVVAIGYDEKNMIVQDVGTRNGDHYIYNEKIFANAWHDWAGSAETIEQGKRNMLVLSN